jgi:ribosome maturation factor RimP
MDAAAGGAALYRACTKEWVLPTHSFLRGTRHVGGRGELAEERGGGLLARAEAIAEPLAREAGLVLVDVEHVREGGRVILRFVVDHPGGVGLDAIASFHRALEPALDAADLIAGRHYVEVSSPGLLRPLRRDRDFETFRGRTVHVRTYAPVEGSKEFTGRLDGLVDGEVRIHLEDGRDIRIPRGQVARARLHADL